MSKHIHLLGFGSQGAAWAQNLRDAGWRVSVHLGQKEGKSAEQARRAGFTPLCASDLSASIAGDPSELPLVAMLIPDDRIGAAYADWLAPISRPLTAIVAHGYAVYSGDLRSLAPGHEAALLAPKAIGPKLRAACSAAKPGTHELVAAIFASPAREPCLRLVARGLGFADENLVPATFEQETIGDLISEQSLLCGGVFNLLQWTADEMARAGVPEKLIREECVTELELIAGLIRESGPAATLAKISRAALAGTIAMRERLEAAGIDSAIASQARSVLDKSFVTYFRRGDWEPKARALKAGLARLERKQT